MRRLLSTSLKGWYWLNILALDAPVIACVWLIFLAQKHGVAVGWLELSLLFIAVWIIYMVDRLVDAQQLRRLELSPRHLFYKHHRWAMLAMVLFLTLLAGYLSSYLDRHTFISGIITGLLCACYLYFARSKQYLPKEVLAAGIFSLGSSLLLWHQAASWALIGDSMALAGLCLLNMGVIALADAATDKLQGQHSLALRYEDWENRWLWLQGCFALGLLSLLLWGRLEVHQAVYFVSQLGFLSCYLLWRQQHLSATQVHSYADLSLLLPPLLAIACQICYLS